MQKQLLCAACARLLGTLLAAGTAWPDKPNKTPRTGGLPAREANLEEANANLGACTEDLGRCEEDLALCEATQGGFAGDEGDGIGPPGPPVLLD